EDTLKNQADQFEFHAIVKLLEKLKPHSAPIGEGADPQKEAFRIATNVSLDFPPTDVLSVAKKEGEEIPTLTTNFLGIAGISGPLPTPYTQLLIERKNRK